MPVPAVMKGGMPTVSSGSQITHLRHHLRMEDHLLRVRLLVGDDAGAADLRAGAGGRRHGDDRRDRVRVGARPPVADILEIPDRPRLPGHEGDELAGIEAAAAAEGDDAVMLAGLEDVRRRAVRLDSTGFGRTSEKMPGVSPPLRITSSARCVMSSLARPESVTSSGCVIPAALQASASSAIRPAPKRMAVG